MKKLYIDTLRRFLEDQDDVVERLRHLIATGDIPAAAREAHTLKGAAGIIEAREILGLARDVEQVLDGGDLEAGRILISRLGIELAPLLKALHAAIDCDRSEAAELEEAGATLSVQTAGKG